MILLQILIMQTKTKKYMNNTEDTTVLLFLLKLAPFFQSNIFLFWYTVICYYIILGNKSNVGNIL